MATKKANKKAVKATMRKAHRAEAKKATNVVPFREGSTVFQLHKLVDGGKLVTHATIKKVVGKRNPLLKRDRLNRDYRERNTAFVIVVNDKGWQKVRRSAKKA